MFPVFTFIIHVMDPTGCWINRKLNLCLRILVNNVINMIWTCDICSVHLGGRSPSSAGLIGVSAMYFVFLFYRLFFFTLLGWRPRRQMFPIQMVKPVEIVSYINKNGLDRTDVASSLISTHTEEFEGVRQ